MSTRKGKLKAVGLILIGFIMGALIAGIFLVWHFAHFFRQQYYTGILSITNTAYMVRANREEELLKIVEANIRQCVVAADSMCGDNEERLDAFWLVQRYYEKFDLPIPDDIEPILNRLPPRPLTSCELRHLDEEFQEQEAEQIGPPD